MLVIGYVFAGLAVGADVPASWTLIAETRAGRQARPPRRHRAGAVGARAAGRAADGVRALRRSACSGSGSSSPTCSSSRSCCGRCGAGMRESPMLGATPRSERRDGLARRPRALQPRLPRAAAVPHRHVRDLEPEGRHERLLPALHPAHRRRPEPGRGASRCRRASFLLVALGVAVRLHARSSTARTSARCSRSASGCRSPRCCCSRCSRSTPAVAFGYVVLLGLGGGFGPQPFFQLWSAEIVPDAAAQHRARA